MKSKTVVLLNGSPKSIQSTSFSLGNYMVQSLNEMGYSSHTLHLLSCLKKESQEWLNQILEAEIIILTSPLYVDSLPSSAIKTLELISRKTLNQKQKWMIVLNCGFPQSHQAHTAIKIFEVFTQKNKIHFLGGLSVGAGPAINGQPLEKLGGMATHVIKGLDLAVSNICANENISKEAKTLVGKKMLPTLLYHFVGNQSFKKISKKLNGYEKMYDRPFERK